VHFVPLTIHRLDARCLSPNLTQFAPMNYQLKNPLGAIYDYDLEKIQGEFAAGKLAGAMVSHPDVGRWIPVEEFLADLRSVQDPPPVVRSTIHCFVVTNGERRGPFLHEQLRSMYMNGAITADAAVTWEGCVAPVPIASVVNGQMPAQSAGASTSSHPPSSAPSTNNWRAGLAVVGGIIGLLVSYLMRPTLFGMGPSFSEWFTEGFTSPYASTIYVCIAVGLFGGFVAGSLVGSGSPKR